MNNIRALQQLTSRELELGLAGGTGSWHEDYSHSHVIYIGGIDELITLSDLLTIFEQYGIIDEVHFPKESLGKEAKHKGFCFLTYRDQRSTILAVDNFNGIKINNKVMKVDHVMNYKQPKDDKYVYNTNPELKSTERGVETDENESRLSMKVKQVERNDVESRSEKEEHEDTDRKLEDNEDENEMRARRIREKMEMRRKRRALE
mmetsp:Transcript_13091/g.23547  ORF Transcript_13091/g.23547 Transcript_13091/m.23547 type:complete len:204 (-) Transcript_13091:3166-3777(-)